MFEYSALVPVDLSKSFLENAQNYMSKEKPGMNMHPCNDNFFTNQFTIPGSNRLAVLFGSTITNIEMMEGEPFPRHKIVCSLRNLRNLTGNDNQMLISFDANSNLKDAFGAYEGAHWERFVTNLVHIIDKVLKSGEGFTPEACKFDAVLDKNNHAIHHCLQTTKGQNFSVGQKSFTIEASERFVTINTLKYPVTLFQSICREAGFEVNDLLHLKGNEMRLQHLYC